MRRLVYLAGARTAFREIADYIAMQSGNRGIARHFVASLRERCTRLAPLPGVLGTARPEFASDVRSTTHRGYLIFFRYRSHAVEIVTIVRAERDLERLFKD